MKILTIVGARPQFVKAAVVSRSIREYNAGEGAHKTLIREEIVHTGQHYDPGMSQVFFDQMGVPAPVINLNAGSGSPCEVLTKMILGVERELIARRPDCLLVYGDTNSTLAGALAAVKSGIPLIHVEAGLRSYDRAMPEEINRVLTDHASSLLFCPSGRAVELLAREGISRNVHNVGDVMYDAFLENLPHAVCPENIQIPQGPFVLATIHRAANTDSVDRLEKIVSALSALRIPVILPLHPRTKKALLDGQIRPGPSTHIVEPVSYFEMLGLLRDCAYVITDSGGLQKEAYFSGKRCLVLRNETEWRELVELGCSRLVDLDKESLLTAAEWGSDAGPTAGSATQVYGDGHAGRKIVAALAAIS